MTKPAGALIDARRDGDCPHGAGALLNGAVVRGLPAGAGDQRLYALQCRDAGADLLGLVRIGDDLRQFVVGDLAVGVGGGVAQCLRRCDHILLARAQGFDVARRRREDAKGNPADRGPGNGRVDFHGYTPNARPQPVDGAPAPVAAGGRCPSGG